MLRRKPSKIKLQVEDLQEYLNHCKDNNKEKQSETETKPADSSLFADITSTTVDNRNNLRNRQAEVQRRIGFQPQPITPESTSHYSNIH
uniref:Uncharacterized protein n=1 Tax=Ciona savignyi TaxID=51511 RepID=H2YCZ0_CIOSA